MRKPLALIAALGLVGALSSCTQFPELDASVTNAARAAPYPDLVPLGGLQARLNTSNIAPDTVSTIEARIARLEARADRLRGSVIDDATRARMQAGVRQ
ncbi:hypothetical protein [Roseovarius arcticus]|uniref:hypothetical protein n=1 Tax=Roseovarius arcticus TaxID=2547404 RepID=UPI00111044DB|nr:hypothetical protein [Roseovarius arcticus]